MANDDSTIQRNSSPFLRKYVDILKAAPGPCLDAPSGAGRNALLLQSLGCSVVCVDNDAVALEKLLASAQTFGGGSILPVLLDLESDYWPFLDATFGAALNIHYVSELLCPRLIRCLRTGGILLVETFDNRGQNYLQLPKKNQLKDLLGPHFKFLTYEEKAAGPTDFDAVTVRLVAEKE